MRVLTCGSLFAGVGGFDIAAERAGMEVAWQSEVDKHASAVLEHHWPGLNIGDIHDVIIADDECRYGTAPAVDVLCGGFPCQDYSVAGNREGLAGDRGALWWEFHRLIREGRPTWVIGENVPGLLSSRNGEDFATIIESLTELGYGVVWAVLDAQYFGVAQRRRRVFIVGHSGGQPRPEILALSEGLFGYPAPSRETRQETAGTVAVGSHGSGDIIGSLTRAFDSKNYSNVQEVSAGSLVAFTQNTRDEVRIINGDGQISGALAAETGTKQQTYLAGGPQVRRLTPLECERLQGFPDNWTAIDGNSDTQRYRQMGNAVAVPVVEWIMKRITNGQD